MRSCQKSFFEGDVTCSVFRHKGGYTLLEVVIAGSIFAMLALGFSAGLISAIRTQQMAHDRYIATTIARNHIQRARTLPFNSVHLIAEDYIPVNEEGYFSQSGKYRRTTSVTNISATAVQMQVDVFVPLRRDAGLSDVPVSITTILAERDLIGNSI